MCVCVCVCVSVYMCVREIGGWNYIKSCIKAAAYLQFFNILLRLLIKCGFYSRAADMQCSESGTCLMYSESATLHCECNKIV